MRKKIAVNTRLLLPGRVEGISRFAQEVLKRMIRNNPDIEFHFFFDRPYDPAYLYGPNVIPHVIHPQSRHPILWYLWFHIMLPWKIRQIKPDLFFSPEFYLSSSKQVPQYSVIHDLAYEHFPEDLPFWASRYLLRYSPLYARWAKKVLTVSGFSKMDIHQKYDIPTERIHVVYNGVSDHFGPLGDKEQQNIRQTYSDGKPFFHFVGTLHPRKNIRTLLVAFDQFKEQSNSEVQLLLVGRRGWKNQEALKVYEAMKHKNDVRFSGFVADDELARIYASSLALVYIPTLEGFGIPVLEAMQSETAVICSHSSSLPEVAGEAAILVDPYRADACAAAMQKIWEDSAFRSKLIQKGLDQKEKFSWDKTYLKVWKVLSAEL